MWVGPRPVALEKETPQAEEEKESAGIGPPSSTKVSLHALRGISADNRGDLLRGESASRMCLCTK